jgi:lysophospholipase L1-like esterase
VSELTGKTTKAFGVLLLLLAVPHLSQSPWMQRARIGHLPWESELQAETEVKAAPTPIATGEAKIQESENRATVNNSLSETKSEPLDPTVLAQAAGSLSVEQPQALDVFYTQLAETIRAKEPHLTRILHYGDSVITSDYISGTMRRLFQARFGDGGHGFILAANGWEWYFHNDVNHFASQGWSKSSITGPLTKDSLYGLGGVVFRGSPGATATFGPASSGDYGRKVSKYDVYYLSDPQGGEFEVKLGKGEPEVVSTKADVVASKVATYAVPDGETKLTVRALGKGSVRVFGATLERDVAGVTYDALGALGSRAKMWSAINGEHWRDQLALRKPSLIVLQFGTNESEDGFVNQADYEKTVSELIDKVKLAAPSSAILVAAPLDRAERGPGGALKSAKALTRLVGFQERVAKEKGVAFWNTWKAMGGEGTMGRWLNAKPQLCSGDLTHPTPKGAEVIGTLFFRALVSGYEAWASRTPGAPPLPPEK